jgi:hypothetical protein
VVDFKNTVIVMTTNLGTRDISKSVNLGFSQVNWMTLLQLLAIAMAAAALLGGLWVWHSRQRQDPWLHALQQARRRLLHMGLPVADSAAITPRQLLDLLAQHQARANTAADAWGAWQQWLQALEAVRYAPAGSTQHAATTPTAQLRQLKTRLPRLPQLPLAQAQPAQTQPSTG